MMPIDEIYKGWYWVHNKSSDTMQVVRMILNQFAKNQLGCFIHNVWIPISELSIGNDFISRIPVPKDCVDCHLDRAQEKIERLREALEFYAKRENHRIRVDAHGKILQDSECFMDFGKRAKEALK